jgi:hypothetical protein
MSGSRYKSRNRSRNRKRSLSKSQYRESDTKVAKVVEDPTIYDDLYKDLESEQFVIPQPVEPPDHPGKYPDFVCFTWYTTVGGSYVITIHDTTPFEEHKISVCVGSHTRHNTIIQERSKWGQVTKARVFVCYDCKKRESQCGPFDMYHVVHYGLPKVLCSECWTKSGNYPGYKREAEENFYKLLSDPDVATIQQQKYERLDTFIVEDCNERKQLTRYLFKLTVFELLMYAIVSISCLHTSFISDVLKERDLQMQNRLIFATRYSSCRSDSF